MRYTHHKLSSDLGLSEQVVQLQAMRIMGLWKEPRNKILAIDFTQRQDFILGLLRYVPFSSKSPVP